MRTRGGDDATPRHRQPETPMRRSYHMYHPINRGPRAKARRRIGNAAARIAYCIVRMTNRTARESDRAARDDDRTGGSRDHADRIGDHARGGIRSVRSRRVPVAVYGASYTPLEDSRRDDRSDRSARIKRATARQRRSRRANRKQDSLSSKDRSLRRSSGTMPRRPDRSPERKRTTADGSLTWPVSIATSRCASATHRLDGVQLVE
jgi:hypothetical protein